MMKVYLGKLIPLGGRPKHFEEAELKCGEGPFVGPPSGWQPHRRISHPRTYKIK